MIIRFNDIEYRAAELRDAVYWCYANTLGSESCIEDGVEYTPFVIKQHIYLLDNYDLYIDDAFNGEIAGMFMQALRSKGFLEEKAQIIVPKVYRDTRPFAPPIPDDAPDADEGNNIECFEDHLPDTVWDDGKFEAEMNEILNNPNLYNE